MSDLNKQKIDINCPNCGRSVKVILGQVVQHQTLTCSCGQRIQLADNKGSVKKNS